MITEMVIRELYDAASEEYCTIAVDCYDLLFENRIEVDSDIAQNEFFFLALDYIKYNFSDVDTSQAKIDTYYTK
jgi:hypothetical protein